jgi:hypothetical protein
MADQAKRRFQFSLAGLILFVVGIGAAILGVAFFAGEATQYAQCIRAFSAQQNELTRLNKMVDWHVGNDGEGRYPGCLDDIYLLKGQDCFYTNLRCAERDVGFYTVRGLTTKDVGAIWLYDELPEEARELGRLVIKVGHFDAVLLSEADFQAALATTLAKPGTQVVANNRRQSKNVKVNVTEEYAIFAQGASPCLFWIWRDKLRLKRWPFVWSQSTPFLIIAVAAFSTMGYRWWRQRKSRETAS